MYNVELFTHIRDTYRDGFYCYSFVINPKPDGPYDILHPKKAHKKFEETFKKYLGRHPEYSFLCFPEISDSGKYHIHGLFFHKIDDFDEHQKKLKLVKNWMRRIYGWNAWQRIYSFTEKYKTEDIRCLKYGMWTTFEKVYDYITKDVEKYKFLYSFGSV